jgi:hypothetical protein
MAIEPGIAVELTFALPTEEDMSASVLVRASASALRVSLVDGETAPVYGVAGTIDHIDFVQPVISNAA